MEGDESSGWKPGQPTVFPKTMFDEVEPMFSPDGRWLAYQSQNRDDTKCMCVHFRDRVGNGRYLLTTALNPCGREVVGSCSIALPETVGS
jgi:WD40 repeat protein